MQHEEYLEKVLYCIDGYISDHNNRNYGDSDEWLRHVRNDWENFIESHPDSLNPLEYIKKMMKDKEAI